MGEDERGAGDVADFGGAGGDVLQGPPSAGEQGEPALAEAAQRPLDGVTGPGVDIEVLAVCGLLDRDVNADARALVAGIGESWQAIGGSPVQPGQGVKAG